MRKTLMAEFADVEGGAQPELFQRRGLLQRTR